MTMSLTASRGPLERDDLPYEAWLVKPGFESALLDCGQDSPRRVQEDSELHPDDAEGEVDNRQTKPGPPAVVWKAHVQHAIGAHGRGAGKHGHVLITTDGPIHVVV